MTEDERRSIEAAMAVFELLESINIRLDMMPTANHVNALRAILAIVLTEVVRSGNVERIRHAVDLARVRNGPRSCG